MSNYTQTPWTISEIGFYGEFDIIAENTPNDGGDIICSAPIEWESSMARWRENAERIVTCVNAMGGLTNEEVTNLRKDADQEKENVAVAFAEWKDNDTILMDGKHRIMKTIKSNVYGVYFENNSDLFKYFITNVYNK